MRNPLFFLVACLALTGCAPLLSMMGAGVPAPVQLADKTGVDESALRLAETAYGAERTLIATAADAGLLTGANAAKAAEFDNKAYAALGAARRAYAGLNAADFASAVSELRDAVTSVVALVKK